MTLTARFQSGLTWVALATFVMAFKGIFAGLIYQTGVAVSTLLFWRFTLAVPLFWLGGWLLLRAHRSDPLSAAQWRGCILAGLLFFISAYFDFVAIDRLGASLSRLILYLFPALVVAIQVLLTRQIPTGRQLIAFVVTWFGVGLVLSPGYQGPGLDGVGVACAFGAATCYAIFWHVSQPLTRTMGSVRFNQVANSFTLVAAALVLLPQQTPETLILPTAPAWGWMILLVVLTTVLPFFLLFEGLRRADAGEAGLVSMFGPVITVLAAWWFLDERLTALQWLGMAIVLAGVGWIRVPGKQVDSQAAVKPE